MPFIPQERREQLPNITFLSPGDRCYIFYKEMVRKWRDNPRWTTAHRIYQKMQEDLRPGGTEDVMIAYQLAWQVFFIKHVMPYEDEREEENGSI